MFRVIVKKLNEKSIMFCNVIKKLNEKIDYVQTCRENIVQILIMFLISCFMHAKNWSNFDILRIFFQITQYIFMNFAIENFCK